MPPPIDSPGAPARVRAALAAMAGARARLAALGRALEESRVATARATTITSTARRAAIARCGLVRDIGEIRNGLQSGGRDRRADRRGTIEGVKF